MNVQIKDVMIKELPEGGVVAFDKASIANAKPVAAKPAGKGKAKANGKAKAK